MREKCRVGQAPIQVENVHIGIAEATEGVDDEVSPPGRKVDDPTDGLARVVQLGQFASEPEITIGKLCLQENTVGTVTELRR